MKRLRIDRCRQRIARCLVVLIAGFSVASGFAAVTATPASAGTAYVASNNMCVDYCHRPGTPQNREPNNPVDFVYNQVVSSPSTPWIVGLQETCTLKKRSRSPVSAKRALSVSRYHWAVVNLNTVQVVSFRPASGGSFWRMC